MKKFFNIAALILAAAVAGAALAGCGGDGGSVYVVPISPSVPKGFVKVEGATIDGEKYQHFAGGSVFTNGNPPRKVKLSTFYMCDHETTQDEFKAVMGTNPSHFDGSSGKEPASGETQGNRPVDGVSWYAAIAYCNKRSAQEGLECVYTISGISDWKNFDYANVPTSSAAEWSAAACDLSKNGYRLPTEAEWEYAARNGPELSTDRWSGTDDDNKLKEYAWYDKADAGKKTHAVKTKKPNRLGIYDMTGNVRELCWDWYNSDPGAGDETDGSGFVTNPLGPKSGSERVTHDRSIDISITDSNVPSFYTITSRSSQSPEKGNWEDSGNNNYLYYGFRVVRSSL